MGDHIFCYYFKLFQVGIFLMATTTKIEVSQKEFRATELLEIGQSSSWSHKSSSRNKELQLVYKHCMWFCPMKPLQTTLALWEKRSDPINLDLICKNMLLTMMKEFHVRCTHPVNHSWKYLCISTEIPQLQGGTRRGSSLHSGICWTHPWHSVE